MQSPPHNRFKYYKLYKPYGYLCQFTSRENTPTLAGLGSFDRSVYPVGRLDKDSEGLVLLTNDGMLKHVLLEPRYGHPREYLAQVEGIPTTDAIERLKKGVVIDGSKTLPAGVELLVYTPDLPERSVPIRLRKFIPTSWLRIVLREGRNRQVRNMTAAVGFPTLRLVRVAIGTLQLENMQPGEVREMRPREIQDLITLSKGSTLGQP